MSQNLKTLLGFTLLEILISLFIFTIISTIMFTSLHTILNAQTKSEKNATRFSELEMALTYMSHDFQQTINRPITLPSGILENALIGQNNTVAFTHAGLANPFGQLLRSSLQRVSYQIEKENLIRLTWPSLDQTSQSVPSRRVILKSISQLNLEYLDEKGKFHFRWPPSELGNISILPKAVRVSLTLEDLGKIHQLYLIPGLKSDNDQ